MTAQVEKPPLLRIGIIIESFLQPRWVRKSLADALCMSCADMDHLVFLESGDAALTRRAKRASRLSAVVVRFSRARRRYERQRASKRGHYQFQHAGTSGALCGA